MSMNLSLSEKIELCCNAAMSKKADDVVALDLRGLSSEADAFIVAGANSNIQAQTIIDAVEEVLRASGEKKYHIEGYNSPKWTLIDSGDVIIHVFQREAREFYGLERVWGDAERFAIENSLEAPIV